MEPAGRRWSLAAAISSIAVFGIGIGVGAPLLSLMLEERGTDSSINGLNAAMTFIGVMLGPLLTPRLVARFGFKHFLLVALPLSLVLFLLLKPLDNLAIWFVLRFLGGVVGSSIFTATEAWISQLAGDKSRGRVIAIYAASLSAGFATGPIVLSLTGIAGWPPFIACTIIEVFAMLPLLAVPGGGGKSEGESSHPLAMMRRMPVMAVIVGLFAIYEGTAISLLPVWGQRTGHSAALSASLISAIFIGAIVLQYPIGWLSDRVGRGAALRLCGIVGLAGAAALPLLADEAPFLLIALFVWGGFATSLYPIALSMAGDRFSGTDLINANAALVIAYGLGAFVGPIVAGVAMDLWNPHGMMVVEAILFAALLVTTLRRGGTAPSSQASSAQTGR